MKLEKLELQNFRSYSKLSLDLTQQGFTLILGGTKNALSKNNGFGKSSIYYSIIYALYGELPSGVKGDAVINSHIGKNCYVKLSFSARNKHYKVERYRKDSEHKNKVLLYKDGKDISLPTNKGTDAKIISIINLSMKTLLNSIVFTSETMNAFTNAADKERKTILEELTNTSVYKKALALVKEDSKNNSVLLTSSIKDKNALDDKLDYYKKSLDQYKNQARETENKVNKLRKRLSELQQNEFPSMDILNNKLEGYESQYTSLSETLYSIKYNDTSSLVKVVNELRNDYKQCVQGMKDAKKIILDNRRELKSIELSPNPVCKLCGNELTDEHKKIEQNRLAEQINDNIITYKKLKSKLDEYTSKGKQKQQKLSDFNKKNDTIKSQVQEVQAHMQKVTELITSVKNTISAADKNLHDKQLIEQEISDYKAMKLEAPVSENDLAIAQNKQNELIKSINKLKEKERKFKELQVVFGNQGVKSHVLGLMIPYINEHMDSYMQVLSDTGLTAGISNFKENKDGSSSDKLDIIVENNGEKQDFSELSSGEKKRIAIALNLSFMSYLSTRITDINIAVFDEVFDSLDKAGVDAVILLLKQLSNSIETVFVISHNPDLKFNDTFDKSILITKENGISKLIG